MRIRLNDEQARAAEQLEGPVLVTAGAGSGKTRMLTERFANAVVGGRLKGWDAVDPGRVVAITYTEKAAGEIAERVRAEIRSGDAGRTGSREDLWISTIHGFCTRLLRRNPFEAGIDPLFAVADSLKSGRLRERAFGEALARLDENDAGIRELLDVYGEDAVFEATLETSRQLAVAGLDATAIVPEPAPTIAELIAEAKGLFADGTTVCDIDYTGSSTTHLEHAQLCRDLLDECSQIDSGDRPEHEVFARIRILAEAYAPIRRLVGFEDLKEEMVTRKARLLGHVATALVSPYQRDLVGVVGEYALRYAQLKREAGVLDFEDLQLCAVRLLERNPELAADYDDHFRVVMVDEFQDTDALQLRLIERVAGENLCTVGDEMQSIYGFRGADVEVYRSHREAMSSNGALKAELAINYRSHPQIIEFVNAVFGSAEYTRNTALPLRPVSEGRESEHMDQVLGADARVEVLVVDSGDTGMPIAREREADEIASRLAELRERGMDPGDVAILLRAYKDAHVYADALARKGIPAAIVGGSRFFGLAETAVMKALTRVIANVADETALGTLLASEFVSVSDDALLKTRLDSEGPRRGLWELVCSEHDMLDSADALALHRLREVIESARARVGREPLEDVLLKAVEEAGYDLRLIGRGNMGRDAFANVLKFARRAAEFELNEGSGPAGFAAHLEDKERLRDLEAPDSATDDEFSAVRIMSIHASKGLEFPVVVVPDIGRKAPANGRVVRVERIPDALRIALKTPKGEEEGKSLPDSEWFTAFSEADAEAEAEGAERLFYVALTRARDLLLVSGCGALNPKTRPASKNDLVKLIRVLGHDLPIGEPRDELVTMDGEAACQLRVAAIDELGGEVSGPRGAVDNAPPPAFGRPTRDEAPSTRLPKTVSYTQLSEFARCPRQFKIRRVLGISPPPPVAGAHRPTRLGTALHAVLRLVSPEGTLPGSDRMAAIARYFELEASEVDRLVEAASRWRDSDVARRVRAADIVLHEAPLSISVNDGAFVIAGSIDLYARSGTDGLIVDYKSGTSGVEDELPGRYQLQADCYALAALLDGCERVEVVFARPEVIRDGAMERVTFTFSAPDAERIDAALASTYREMESSAFEPMKGKACVNCEVPPGLCEHRSARGE